MAKSTVTIDSLLTAAAEAMRRSEAAATDFDRRVKEEDRAYQWAKRAVERIELRREARDRAEFHRGSGSVYDKHDYEPGTDHHSMHTDPLCHVCGKPKADHR